MQMIRRIVTTAFLVVSIIILGQNKETAVPDSLKRSYYNIVFPKIAPSGRYVVFNKNYDRTSDTVVLLDRKYPKQVIFERGGVNPYSVCFTSKDDLFMRTEKKAQLLLLPSLTQKVWQAVSNAFYISTLKQIVLLQNDNLIILDEKGRELKSIKNVIGIKEQENSLYYTVKDHNIYKLNEWNGFLTKVLHTSENSKLEVQHRDKRGMFIWEINGKTGKGELIYKRENNMAIDPLSSWYKGTVNSVEVSKLDDRRYFIHMYSDTVPKDKSAVEIWYGNDPKIQTKFFGDSVGRYFIWDPIGNEFSQMTNSELSHHVNVGNNRYLLSFDPYFKHDYTKKFKSFTLYRYDTLSKKYDFLANAGTIVFTDQKGKFLLTYQKGESWDLYNIETFQHDKITVPEYENAYFSEDGKNILFEGTGKLYHYELATKKLHSIPIKAGFRNKIKNGIITGVGAEFNIFQQTYSLDYPTIIELYDNENIRNSWFSYEHKDVKEIIPATSDDINSVSWDSAQKIFSYIKSNLNLPPQLIIKKDKKEELVYQSNKHDTEASKIKSEVINYKNSRGVPLKGLLLYPIEYDATKKYPMVVTIYQKLRYNMNKYLIDGIGMNGPTEGINIRTLLRKGYIVYMPDIVFDERGTGRAALDCINKAMDAIQENIAVDFTKVALVGHSHGGYETNFIATQSNRFATYISGAGNSDLVRSYHSFNYNFSQPFFWQYEDGQYEMPGPFTENKSLYIDNSPIYHAEKVGKPILLWSGMKDYNIFWEQTMEFYLGLRRNKKQVIALFYPDDGHSFSQTKNRIDLYSRVYEWLDYHLKNKKSKWIEKIK